MVNFRELYRHAEEHVSLYIGGLFVMLAVLIVAQSIFSPLWVLSGILSLVFLILTFRRPLWTLAFLAFYLPFEPFILKFIPDEIYIFARYSSEVLIYLLVAVVIWKLLTGEKKIRQTPIDLTFILLLISVASSIIINFVPATVAVLGLRQIFRFVIVFFIVVYLKPSKEFIKRLTVVMIAIVMIQSVIGISQAIVGGPLDDFLIPSESRTFGDITLTSGVVQFWDPGSRVFATLGRYDRLGNLLYFFLLIGIGLIYEKRIRKHKTELLWLFALGLPTLVLTFSRASWFAFLLGFLFIGLIIKKDKRILTAVITFLIVVSSYLALTGLNVRMITEAPGQTLVERFYESFSYARWRGEYYGLGRTFWYVQTPLVVIPASPIFGFGPGQFGGGVVAALRNTTVYDQVGLPFGVFGTEGYIDNSWFSLWGEIGTLGMIFYLWIYLKLFVTSIRLYKESHESMVRGIAIGFAAAMIGIAFNAFLSTLLEIRTAAFYLWLYAGFIVVLYNAHEQKAGSRKQKVVRV
ncbi:O-antigen ligase family protein [Patescibacteria group bacterium]